MLEDVLYASQVLFVEVDGLSVGVEGVPSVLGPPDTDAVSSWAVWGAEV